jgi:hypothetical protein
MGEPIMATRPNVAGNSDVTQLHADGGSYLASFPAIRSILLDTRYDGSEALRRPGTLFIRAEGGRWLFILKDPSSGLQMKIGGPTFEDTLAALELVLASGDGPWELDPFAPTAKKKKK